MRKASALIIVVLAILTAGCALSGKPAKQAAVTPAVTKPVPAVPAPPPPPLSIPQTQIELPKPQPFDPAALVTEPAPPAEAPPETSTPRTQTPGRRPSTREGTATPPATNVTPAPALPPAAAPTEQVTSPIIQEIVPQAEVKRLQDQAAGRRREARQIVDQLARRQLSAANTELVNKINSLIASSLDAEKKGDMKTADLLAERAQILAKDLLNAR